MSWSSCSVDGILRKKRAVLACSGPSLDRVTEEQWKRIDDSDDIVLAAVNNAPLSMPVRPFVWITCDNPNRFTRNLWTRSFAHKFALKNWRNSLIIKDRRDITWYEVHSHFRPETFLTEKFPTWGTQHHTDPMRHGIRSIMLIAIWTLYKMGVREIDLVGCDFQMKKNNDYAGHRAQWSSSAVTNNNVFGRLNRTWFPKLLPHFDKCGLTVNNCSVGGFLDALPRVDLDEILQCDLH